MSDKPIRDIQPDAIALDWSKKLITAITHGLEKGQTSIELGGRFNVVYHMNRWEEALQQALQICEYAEEYEQCANIANLIMLTQMRMLAQPSP